MEPKAEFVKQVENHLSDKDSFIAICFGDKKLQKQNTHSNKYNWSKEDILKESTSIAQFIEQLPAKGFLNGSVLIFRKKSGNACISEAETTLNFSNTTVKQEPQQKQTHTESMDPAVQSPSQNHQQYPTPQVAMGYASIAQDDLITMKVNEQRHLELMDRLKRAEKERDTAESDLRISKEKNASLNRKLETIEDKHEWAIMKLEKDQTKFWETDAGKAAITTGMEALPALAMAFTNKGGVPGAQAAMAGPTEGMSQEMQLFIQSLKSQPQEELTFIMETVDAIVSIPEFKEQILLGLNQLKQHQNA